VILGILLAQIQSLFPPQEERMQQQQHDVWSLLNTSVKV